jgi:hypothetical protein
MVLDDWGDVVGVKYKGVKYHCFTSPQARDIAFEIYSNDANKKIIDNLTQEVNSYKNLVFVYQQDSITAKMLIKQLSSNLTIVNNENIKLRSDTLLNNKKVKRRNTWIWLLGTFIAVENAGMLYYKFKNGF